MIEEYIILFQFIDSRADFNSNKQFYRQTMLRNVLMSIEQFAKIKSVEYLLDEIIYHVLIVVDKRTLKIVLLEMQGNSTKEFAVFANLTIEHMVSPSVKKVTK